MKIADFDFSRCHRPEKDVCAGLCLSFDLMRGLCMETADLCVALRDSEEPSAGEGQATEGGV